MSCCAKCAYADAMGVPAECAGDAIGGTAGALLENESMVFAKRLNEAITSLSLDILAANWMETAPQLIAAWDMYRAQWSAFYPTTQSRHAILVGVDDEALGLFRIDYEKWRQTYKNITKREPSGPDPQVVKPGENAPQIQVGFGGGLGFGVAAAAVLLYLVSRSRSSSRGAL